MEQVINNLIALDEAVKHKGMDPAGKNASDVLAQVTEFLSKAHRGILEMVYNSLGAHTPEKYFFLWISLLEAESQLFEVDVNGFIRRVQTFVAVCDRDLVKSAVPKFVVILRNFTDRLVVMKKPMSAIRALKTGLSKISPGNEHLTPIHAMLMQVCLLSKNYKAGYSILERDITEVDSARTGVQPLDGLLYFYYGGMIYIGLKQYKKASDFFSMAISSPAHALSAVAIECHKKYILVSLLLEGQVPNLPKYTSGFVLRQLKVFNATYLEFAKAYQTHKQDALKESFNKSLTEFTKDKNTGLAAQVVESLYRRNILRLTQTYVTLSLADIATSVQLASPQEAEEHLLRMIEDGVIHAKIDQKEGMVSFKSNPEQYNTDHTRHQLDAYLKQAATLGNRVEELHKKVALSSSYLNRVSQTDKAAPIYDEAEFVGPSDRNIAHGGVQLQ